jgi:NADH:ubiquinone oxidoreductase subunit 5 (subunit L)/multisubunit Na+/H+ antiporter MnhA subunit
VLAFSTISQLGYMFVGLGLGGEEFGSSVGMFHLFTHAFFKALLFLGAGSVIHSLHHATHKEMQDMRQMGGLAKYMPITALTWLIAVLAISGFPFFSGFFSKEKILEVAFEQHNWAIYLITLGTAGLTAFYMLRAYLLTFGGPDGKFGGFWGGTYRGEGHPHENPWQIAVPLILLGIPSIFAGYWTGFFEYSNPGIHEGLDIAKMLGSIDTWIGVAVSLVGLIVAYVMYCRVQPSKLANAVQKNGFLSGLHRILFNRYYVDTLYDGIVRYIVLGISQIEQAFDTYVVDGIVNGLGKAVMGFGRGLRRVETGLVQSYMYGFFGGIVVLAVVAVVLVTFYIVKG